MDGGEYLPAADGVEHGGRLVHDDAVRTHGDDARDGDALLLPAERRCGAWVRYSLHAHHFQRLVDAAPDLLRRHAQVSGAKATSSSTTFATIWLSGF